MNQKIKIGVFVFLLTCLCCFTIASCGQASEYDTTDIGEYMQMQGHIAGEGLDIRSGLFIFPESVDGLAAAEYRYYCKEGLLDNSYLLFLKATYPNELAYAKEVDRLSGISCTVKTSSSTVVNPVAYSESKFSYPAYIAVYNTDLSFEYALTDDEERSVVYIYIKQCEGADFLPQEYLPVEFAGGSMMDYDTQWREQNIYYTPKDGNMVHYKDISE